jgi:hypothetical protein
MDQKNEIETETKTIIIDTKTPRKRKITKHPKWTIYDSEKDIFLSFFEESENIEQKIFLEKQMKQKIEGYKNQDKKKNLWNPEKFINMEYLQQKIKDSQLCCFYCKGTIRLWYDYVLEPKQWTLERIDNDYGHNIDNVEIACLSCNRKRRCMFHERFRFTKQIQFVKI